VYVARVAAIRIVDNTNFGEAAVRTLLAVRPGMVLNAELVKADEQRLRATGKFGKLNAKIEEGPNPSKPQNVTLVWELSR
jgi:outer membrane protein assembly factor BamA